MRLLAANAALDCTAIVKPDHFNPAVVAKTGHYLLTLQEEQHGLWSDYLYQRVLNQFGGEIIISVSPEQYIKQLYKQYLGYNGVTIHQFLQQICTWFVIMKNDKLKMETYFAALWTDTPYVHVSPYAAQLDKRQLKCVDFDVLISAPQTKSFSLARWKRAGSSRPSSSTTMATPPTSDGRRLSSCLRNTTTAKCGT